jgi:predicted amidophosphoribosyltransferase
VLLADAVAERWPSWPQAVTFVPATRAALLRRGFDHGRGIASAVAQALGVPLVEAIARAAARDQRALGRLERARNVAGNFSASGELPERILLCDDVFTTGATLDAAASALLDQGVRAVRCATVARAW